MKDFQESVEEATIEGIHAAMSAGVLTSQALCEEYLARIESYDRSGPNLNAVVAVNNGAVERARVLDEEWKRSGGPIGPLHGIPVLVKDNIETIEVDTTCGSIALEGYRPEQDATAVHRLREAGAIVLAKTTLPDFAAS